MLWLFAAVLATADVTLNYVPEAAICDVGLTLKGQGHRIVDFESGEDILTYQVPGGPFTEEQCKEQCCEHAPWCAGVAWEVDTQECLVVTDNLHLFAIDETFITFQTQGPQTIESAGVNLTYTGYCKDSQYPGGRETECTRAKVSAATVTNLGESMRGQMKVWGNNAMSTKVFGDVPQHEDDTFLLFSNVTLSGKTPLHNLWALRRFYLTETQCKDLCAATEWCLGVTPEGTICHMLGDSLVLLSQESLDVWTWRTDPGSHMGETRVLTLSDSDTYREFSVSMPYVRADVISVWDNLVELQDIHVNTSPQLHTWVKDSAFDTFSFECSTIETSDQFCMNSGSNCHYPYSSGLELEYPQITSVTDCRSKCGVNELWCFGWELRSNVCTLFTDKNVYYRPGTTEPFYPDNDPDANVLVCAQPGSACSSEQLLPYFLESSPGSYCELHSGSCSYDLRRLTEGACRGGGFLTDRAFKIVVPSGSGDVVDKCKQRCCEQEWCVAVEYRNPGNLYQECDFLVSDSVETFPTPGKPFMEIPRKPTGDTVCFSSIGDKLIDTNSRFVFSGKESCESFNGHPGKTIAYTEGVTQEVNTQDYCAAKCYDTEGCLGFQVKITEGTTTHDCKVHVVDTEADPSTQTRVIRGTGQSFSTDNQCWIDKDIDFYAPLEPESYTQVAHSCDISGVKQVIHRFNYDVASSFACAKICTNNPKMCRGWHSPGSSNFCALAVNWDYLNRDATSHWISGFLFEDYCEQGVCTLEDTAAISSVNREINSICLVRPGYVTPPEPEPEDDKLLQYALGGGLGGLAFLMLVCCVCGEPLEDENDYEPV